MTQECAPCSFVTLNYYFGRAWQEYLLSLLNHYHYPLMFVHQGCQTNYYLLNRMAAPIDTQNLSQRTAALFPESQ